MSNGVYHYTVTHPEELVSNVDKEHEKMINFRNKNGSIISVRKEDGLISFEQFELIVLDNIDVVGKGTSSDIQSSGTCEAILIGAEKLSLIIIIQWLLL